MTLRKKTLVLIFCVRTCPLVCPYYCPNQTRSPLGPFTHFFGGRVPLLLTKEIGYHLILTFLDPANPTSSPIGCHVSHPNWPGSDHEDSRAPGLQARHIPATGGVCLLRNILTKWVGSLLVSPQKPTKNGFFPKKKRRPPRHCVLQPFRRPAFDARSFEPDGDAPRAG